MYTYIYVNVIKICIFLTKNTVHGKVPYLSGKTKFIGRIVEIFNKDLCAMTGVMY